MSDLPEGWEAATVGEIATVQLGRQRSPKNHTGPYMRPYLRSANVTWSGIDVADVKEMNFDPEEAATFELRDGDILLNEASGSPGEVGKPAIWRNEIAGACFQNTLLRVRSSWMDTNYLYWYFYFAAVTGRFGEVGRGVSIRHLGKRGLTSFPIPVPPAGEQRRIASAIEDHFTSIGAAEVVLSQAQDRLTRLMQSILIHAIPCDELPEGWELVTVREAGETDLGRQRAPRYHEGPSMRPYLRVANVFEDRLDLSDVMEMDFDDAAWLRYRLVDGDILLNEGQSPHLVGRPAMYRGELGAVAFTKSLLRFRAHEDVDPEWALLVFRRHLHSRRFMQEAAITTNIAHLPLVRFRTVDFPKPPLDVQRALVAEVRGELEAVDRLSAEVRRAAKLVETLRRRILRSAFEGRLVAQDSVDGQASLLLEMIADDQGSESRSRRRKAAS